MIAGILSRQPSDGRPIQLVAALGEEPQKSVMQQACKRHRHAQSCGRSERKTDYGEHAS